MLLPYLLRSYAVTGAPEARDEYDAIIDRNAEPRPAPDVREEAYHAATRWSVFKNAMAALTCACVSCLTLR